MIQSEGLVKRRSVAVDGEDQEDSSCRETVKDQENVSSCDLSLLEEVFLLGLKDREGTVSFWNDALSLGLRGCILVELGLRGRIALEKPKPGRRTLLKRNVVVKDACPTGDVILDEALKHIVSTYPAESVDRWVSYLSGDTWNPLKMRYHLKCVQNRLAKNLVEKGVLMTQMKTYLLFDTTTYPLVDPLTKNNVIKKVFDTLLLKWINDPQKMNKRHLCMVLLGHASDVLENALCLLSNDDYFTASKRLKELLDMDLEAECSKGNNCEVFWAVFAALR